MANCGVRGTQCYFNDTNVIIDGATISDSNYVMNAQINNNGSIGANGNGTVSLTGCGGGIDFIHSTFDIKHLNINNSEATAGGGMYISDSNGTIKNSSITNCSATSQGGGIWSYQSNIEVENTTLFENEAEYGGEIYTSTQTNTGLSNVTITNNQTTKGSGAGIYAYGTLTISGEDTIISDNTAITYGGGIMVKDKCILNEGKIFNNATNTYAGGGIKVDGKLIMNGGTITNNEANTTGGGVDYANGIFYFNSGTIENNKAIKAGDEIYPLENTSIDNVNPTVEISSISNIWTSKDITVTITVNDDETGIKTVSVNEEILTGNNGTYSYTAQQNGTYEVTVTDNSGNITKKVFTIAYIDKEKPIITGIEDNRTYNEEITINATDTLSGIKSVELLRDGNKISYNLGDKITESGNYTITVEDNVSNIITMSFTIDRALKDSEITIEGINTEWTNQDQVITINITNEIKSIKIDDQEVTLKDGSYKLIVSKNGTYTVEIVDLDGNIITKTITASNIDKDKPVIYGVEEGNTYNGTVNLVIRDELSGIASIEIYKNKEKINCENDEIELIENGEDQVKAIDKAGNENITNFKISINTEILDENEENKNQNIVNDDDNIFIDYGNEDSFDELEKISGKGENDKSMSTNMLPYAGRKSLIIVSVIIGFITLFLYSKVRKYKNV